MTTKRQILAAIKNEYVDIVRGHGYCYFVYDDGEIFETHSVMVPFFNQLDIEGWLYEYKTFYETITETYGFFLDK